MINLYLPLILIGLVLLWVLGRMLWMYWGDRQMEKYTHEANRRTNRNRH